MGNRRPRVSRRLETVAESCAVTDGPSKETSRSARASRTRRARGGGAIMARFPRDSTGTRAVGRSHGTHLRETSRALLLAHLERQPIAAPNAPRARQARTGRHPAGHPRCGVPPLTEMPNTARRRQGETDCGIGTVSHLRRASGSSQVSRSRRRDLIKNENARCVSRALFRRWRTTRMMFDTTTPP